MIDETCAHDSEHPATAAPPWWGGIGDERLHAELVAMDESRLIRAPLDPVACGMMVIGLLPILRGQREALERSLGTELPRCLDRLDPLATAMLRIHAMCTITPPNKDLQPVASELMRWRRTFIAEAEMLVSRGALDRRRMREISGRIGWSNVILDVLMLTAILGDHWDDLEGRSALTRADLGRAETLVDALAREILDLRNPAHIEVADLRHRALSLLVETYDEVRRLVTFVRWREKDIDVIAPSVFTTRARPKRKRASDTARE